VQLAKSRSDVIGETRGRYDYTSETVLDALETVEAGLGQEVVERVTVIQFRRDKCVCKDNGGTCIERRSYLSKLTNVVERCTAYFRDVFFEGKIGIKKDAEVTSVS